MAPWYMCILMEAHGIIITFFGFMIYICVRCQGYAPLRTVLKESNIILTLKSGLTSIPKAAP